MRFKSIFWLFNIVVFVAMILIAGVSILILDQSSIGLFWSNMWILLLVFLILISLLDFYFIRNWKLFNFLELEDWPGLLGWLEERIYIKGQLNRIYSNLLINTALSVSNMDALHKLETEVRQRKPELFRSLGVSLGIPVLLKQNWPEVADYFSPLADDLKTKHRDWARWCRAAAVQGNGIDELLELAGGKDASIIILSAQMLSQFSGSLTGEQCIELEQIKKHIVDSMRGSAEERQLQRSREDHLMAVVLSSRVDRALEELRSSSGVSNASNR
jgi:hypothetical protein